MLDVLLNRLIGVFAPRYWQVYPDRHTGRWKARRWVDGRMVYREATRAEINDAEAYWAFAP